MSYSPMKGDFYKLGNRVKSQTMQKNNVSIDIYIVKHIGDHFVDD